MTTWDTSHTWTAGEVVPAALMESQIRANLRAIGDPWTAYTPTWTGTGFVIGNGTITGAWISAGKLILYRITATIGSTTTVGTGAYSFGLPVAAITTNIPGGGITIFDSSAPAVRQRDVYINAASTVAGQDEAGAFVTGAVPFALATGDTLKLAGVYEAA